MTNLSFARVNLRPPYAALLDADISESDPGYEDHLVVMGTDFFAEAYASESERNAALGPIDSYIELVPASEREVEAVDYPMDCMAIGPALGEAGFEAVADVVLPAAIAAAEDRGHDVTVMVARVRYSLSAVKGHQPSRVIISPLYGKQTTPAEEATARWLLAYVAAKSTGPAV